MTYDPVHDSQRIFRKLLAAHSFPGRIEDIRAESAGVELGSALNPALIALALTLLDGETSFCLLPRGAAGDEGLLSRVTGSPAVETGKARFVFVPAATAAAREGLQGASEGTLEEPWLGATLILEAARVAAGGPVLLEGPGIATRAALAVEGLDPCWLSLRAERCREYPLGLDIILVDRSGLLAALPRTCRAWTEE